MKPAPDHFRSLTPGPSTFSAGASVPLAIDLDVDIRGGCLAEAGETGSFDRATELIQRLLVGCEQLLPHRSAILAVGDLSTQPSVLPTTR